MSYKIRKFDIGYTQVSNRLLIDNRLTPTAKCVYCYLFSKPDGWVFRLDTIRLELAINKNTFYSAVKELVEYDWIKTHQTRNKNYFSHTEYEFINKG